MSSLRINKDLNKETYFLTLTVKNFYYIFDRYQRWEILSDALNYAEENKGLKLFAFVFMLNHIHLICRSNDMSGFLRDFKSYTSYRIKKDIEINEPQILKIFTENGEFNLWSKTSMPKLVETENYYLQKEKYIIENPLKKQYVNREEDWYWSSANSYCKLKIDRM